MVREAALGRPDGSALHRYARLRMHAVACEAPNAGNVADEGVLNLGYSRRRPTFSHEDEDRSWPLHDRTTVVMELSRRQCEWRNDFDPPILLVDGDGGRLRTVQCGARGLCPPVSSQAQSGMGSNRFILGYLTTARSGRSRPRRTRSAGRSLLSL